MSASGSPLGARRALEFPVAVGCPLCRKPLAVENGRIHCPPCEVPECPRSFGYCHGSPDLVVGGRFEDECDEPGLAYEETSNLHTAEHYWVPTFKQLWPAASRPARLLALGCGTGIEVDSLCAAGFDCVGIDCGNRVQVWPRRAQRERLLLANGMHLPFEDAAFDGVFCGCVFPHVGTVGDSFVVTASFREERRALAREMTRVLAPGGKIVVSSPNRRFPFDIFHRGKIPTYRPRPNWPGDPFLLSVDDYRELFAPHGLAQLRTLPIEGYWGFVRSKHSLAGCILGTPVDWYFRLLSSAPLASLRGSPLAPWIVVVVTR
jgi:SAM-dependent methyltransferase